MLSHHEAAKGGHESLTLKASSALELGAEVGHSHQPTTQRVFAWQQGGKHTARGETT